jgi:hypothetical protein
MSAFNLKKYICASTLLLCIGPAAHAACTNASLVGAYGFQEQGQFLGGGFAEFRTVGRIAFDGHGNGRRTTTLWYSDFSIAPGIINPIIYTVNANCTFNYTYLDNLETYSGVIVDGGEKLLWLEISGDPMRSGQAERIRGN